MLTLQRTDVLADILGKRNDSVKGCVTPTGGAHADHLPRVVQP
jgi:hypothetical protein